MLEILTFSFKILFYILPLFFILHLLVNSNEEFRIHQKNDIEAPNETHLFLNKQPMLAPGIPQTIEADYKGENFKYASLNHGQKEWRIEARKAFLYSQEHLVHARNITTYLYDIKGEIITIRGLEAKYFLNKRDLEIFGKVKTIFPDGFEIQSEYLRYLPQNKKIEIPTHYVAYGIGHTQKNEISHFTSNGIEYFIEKAEIHLLKKTSLSLEKHFLAASELTLIESDECLIDRNKKTAKFTMNPHKPLPQRFVRITQPKLSIKSRKADLHYGNFSKILEFLTAYEDVLIQEINENALATKYATAGRAILDSQKEIIRLTEFPQVYQNEDTVTGDLILLHRDTGIIEIEQSNAFSMGKESKKCKKKEF